VRVRVGVRQFGLAAACVCCSPPRSAGAHSLVHTLTQPSPAFAPHPMHVIRLTRRQPRPARPRRYLRLFCPCVIHTRMGLRACATACRSSIDCRPLLVAHFRLESCELTPAHVFCHCLPHAIPFSCTRLPHALTAALLFISITLQSKKETKKDAKKAEKGNLSQKIKEAVSSAGKDTQPPLVCLSPCIRLHSICAPISVAILTSTALRPACMISRAKERGGC
jgi:hypothetical protein